MRYSICMLLVALLALFGVSGCKRMKRLKIPPLRHTCHEQRDLICDLCGEEYVDDGSDFPVVPAPRYANVVTDPRGHHDGSEHFFAVELEFDNSHGFAPIDIGQFSYRLTCGDSYIESIMAVPADAPLPRSGLVPVGESVSGVLLYEVDHQCTTPSEGYLTVIQLGTERWLRTVGKSVPGDLARDLRFGALPRFRADPSGAAAQSP